MKATAESPVSKALRDVWAWKETVYRETENLTVAETLARIHRDAEDIKRTSGLATRAPVVSLGHVAEPHGTYGTTTKRSQKKA